MSLTNVLKKYSQPTPRYTSYPTVPLWAKDVTARDYADSLSALNQNNPLSLYFHLPFCENQCHYCGCSRIVTNDRTVSAWYTQKIVREVEMVSPLHSWERSTAEGRRERGGHQIVTQVHFGGGSPNFFQPTEISTIMQAIHNHFDVATDAEIAIEINPRPNLENFYENLFREGFNRISLGVQDFNEHVQKLINRFQTFEATRSTVSFLRTLGFKHFNFDLICGLPGQTTETFADTLAKTAELSPSRIALYAYAHLPWAFPFQRSFNEKDLPSINERIKIFELAYNFFTQHGYVSIGMDHFARTDDALCTALKNGTLHRNFMGYTTQANTDQVGFGMTAISFVNGNYFQNHKDLALYERCIDAGELATEKGCILSPDDKIRQDLIQKLMCQQKIVFSEFEEEHSLKFVEYFRTEIPRLQPFIDDGLLELTSLGLKVIPPGHLVLRNIAAEFDGYLSQRDKQRFSKTI